jgi:hypothetical protein
MSHLAARRYLSLIVWLIPGLALAQNRIPGPELSGRFVRVHLRDSVALEGTVMRQVPDSFVIQRTTDTGTSDTTLSFSGAARVEARVPRRSGWWLLGGVAAGFAVGVAGGQAASRHTEAHCREQPGSHEFCGLDYWTVPLYALGGAVVGGIGAIFLHRERWELLWESPSTADRGA